MPQTFRLISLRRMFGLIAIAVSFILILASCNSEPELVGTDLEAQAAPQFTLTDHRGEQVSLSDLEGKAVALTFIFTNCPDVCPLIMNRIKTAYNDLPEDKQDDVALVAITVDPDRDTPEVMAEYTEKQGLTDNPNWYGLTGDYETLEPVWESFYISPGEQFPADPEVLSEIAGEDEAESGDHQDSDAEGDHDHGDGEDHESDDAEHDHEEGENTAYWLSHTEAIYIIDAENRMRALLRSDADPADLTHNLEAVAP